MYPERRRGDQPLAGHGNPRKHPPRLELAGIWKNQNRLNIECHIYEYTHNQGDFKLVRQR
jgi:hypothetical protein